MRGLVVAALALAGCFSPKYTNGQLKCGSGAHPCPDGYYCAANHTCWQNNVKPTLDLSVPRDLGLGDMMLPSTDMPHGLRHQGQACTPLDTCDTGFCVDGYCCDSACSNTCQACNVTGNLGICTNVPVGQAPSGARSCNAQSATSCGRDGKCDGSGNCRDWPLGTACSTGTCDIATGNFVYPSTCNGTGTCVPNPPGNCAPFKCQDTTQCYQSCTTSAQCSGSNMCQGGSCGQLPDGRQCTSAMQCIHGNCVDGYCCNSPCTSNCQACNVSGSFGVCTTIPGPKSKPVGTTRSCANYGTTCGGYCDGNNADCTYPPTSMGCGTTCNAGQLQNSFCDHVGGCAKATPTTCSGNYACPPGGSACLNMCSGNADCYPAATYGCSTGAPSTNTCVKFCVWDVNNWDDGCIWAP